MAVVFLAVLFLAVVFLAVDAFAVVFLAVDALAVVDLAVVFLVEVDLESAARALPAAVCSPQRHPAAAAHRRQDAGQERLGDRRER